MPEHQTVSVQEPAEARDAAPAPNAEPRDAVQTTADPARDVPAPADTRTEPNPVDPAYVAKLEKENRKRVGDVAELKRQIDELTTVAGRQRDALAAALGLEQEQTDPASVTQAVGQLASQRDALRADLRRERVGRLVADAARAAGAWDTELALAAVDLDAVQVDERDCVNPDSVQGAVDALRARKPRLFQSDDQRPPLGGTKPGLVADSRTTFKRSQLSDSDFYARHRDAILVAQATGRIVDD